MTALNLTNDMFITSINPFEISTGNGGG
jgi:hypothetical protein